MAATSPEVDAELAEQLSTDIVRLTLYPQVRTDQTPRSQDHRAPPMPLQRRGRESDLALGWKLPSEPVPQRRRPLWTDIGDILEILDGLDEVD